MVAMDTLTQNHHTGAVRWVIEGQVHRQEPSGKGVGKKRGPGSAKMLPRLRIHQLDIKEAMINMGHLKRAIPMSWQLIEQLPIHRLVGIGGTRTSPLVNLLVAGPTLDGGHKGFVTWGAC